MKKFLFLIAACIVLGSCSTGDPATTLRLSRSSRAIVFLECRALSEDEIEFTFSQPVKVTSLKFEPAVKIAEIEDGSAVKVKLEENLPPGILLTADLLAEDSQKNTINVLVPFRARNTRIPKMVINEVRSEQSGNRFEFIEFKMITAGNLGALRVFIASNPKAPMVFQFLPVEVRQGEYVVLHLRTKEENCVNEYGANLAESGGTDALPTARDFWLAGSVELLRKTDIVYVLDQDDNVIDAVMYSEKPDEWWTKTEFAQAAEFLLGKDAWKNADGNACSPQEAVSNAGSSYTKSLSRVETAADTNTAANWYLTTTNKATPGAQNK